MTRKGGAGVDGSRMARLRRLAGSLRDDRGQDLIEYALITAGIGLVTLATWPLVETAIRTSYESLDNDTQDLWQPPDPSGGGE